MSSDPKLASVGDEVTVQVTDQHPHDADAVLAVLRERYQVEVGAALLAGADSVSTPLGAAQGSGRVRSLRLFGTPEGPASSEPVALTGPVDVELLGPADAVRGVRELLTSCYRSEDRGCIPGEHEVEVRLRLT